jgi:dienelactone hydrolase
MARSCVPDRRFVGGCRHLGQWGRDGEGDTVTEAAWRQRFRAPTISMPTWARDEPDRCVYMSNASGKHEVYAWDRSTGERRQLTDRPNGTMSFAIQPGGERVWWFDDTKGNEKGGWRAMPFEGGEAAAAAPSLAPGYSVGLALGRRVAIIGLADVGKHRIDAVADGVATCLYESDQAAGVGGLSRDGGLLSFSHAEHGDSRNPDVRVIRLDGTTVADLSDGPGHGITLLGWSRIEGDQRLLVFRTLTGRRRPAIWHPESGELVDVSVDLPGELLSASWYPEADAILVLHTARGRNDLHRVDLATGSRDAIGTPPGSIIGGRVRPDGELWFVHTCAVSPPVVHCGNQILEPPGERAPNGVPYRDIEAIGPGGVVHGFVAAPEGDGPHPTVLFIHGGPAGVDMDVFSPHVQAWVDHGFAVVMVNYRGSTGYGKDWEDAIVGKPGYRELEDIAAIREVVIGDGTAAPERLVLHGGSWGGYLTLLSLGTQPGLWSLGISVVPLADLAAHYHQQSVPLQAYWRSLFGGTPESLGRDLDAIDPVKHVARIDCPLLVSVGDNDPRCPLEQVLSYARALDAVGKPHELHRYDAGHGMVVVDQQIDFLEIYIDFAARHLGTAKPIA